MAEAQTDQTRPIVFFDVAIGTEPLGRLKLELFSDLVPRTAENFRLFCTGETRDNRTGLPMGYKGSRIHRIVPEFVIQGGDFLNGDGSGSACALGGRSFEDEDLTGKHDQPGVLSMANSGPNSNGCQFFVTLKAAPSLDGKHVVFGRVADAAGLTLVSQLAAVRLKPGSETPSFNVTVAECGEM